MITWILIGVVAYLALGLLDEQETKRDLQGSDRQRNPYCHPTV